MRKRRMVSEKGRKREKERKKGGSHREREIERSGGGEKVRKIEK